MAKIVWLRQDSAVPQLHAGWRPGRSLSCVRLRRTRTFSVDPAPNRITWEALRGLHLPCLLLTGDADLWAPPPVQRLFAQRLAGQAPSARRRHMSGMGEGGDLDTLEADIGNPVEHRGLRFGRDDPCLMLQPVAGETFAEDDRCLCPGLDQHIGYCFPGWPKPS